VQIYESFASWVDGTTLAMKGPALTGAAVDKEADLLSTIVSEAGCASDLCALLKPGEPLVLMGPTETPAGETVLLVGGGLGNAVSFSIGAQLRTPGSRVLYFAGYKTIADRYRVEDIERAADEVVWCSDEPPGFSPGRPQDRAFVGNVAEAIEAYGPGALGSADIPLEEVDRVIAIGSAVAEARRARLKHFFRPDHRAIASINSPMQCMMKEICAQCLQLQRDPKPAPRQSSSPATIRTRRWTASISRRCIAACRRTASRKSSTSCGSTAACTTWVSARCWPRSRRPPAEAPRCLPSERPLRPERVAGASLRASPADSGNTPNEAQAALEIYRAHCR